jgi:hypothetical protein
MTVSKTYTSLKLLDTALLVLWAWLPFLSLDQQRDDCHEDRSQKPEDQVMRHIGNLSPIDAYVYANVN